MRKFIYLLLFSFVVFSCESETDVVKDNTMKEFEFETLTNSKIAVQKEGKIALNVSEEKLLSTFKSYSKKYGEGLEPHSVKLIKVDGKDFLRFYSNDDMVSTVALVKGEDNFYTTGTTVCETKKCASGGGCVPSGDYYTKCRPEGTPPGAPDGDCKRTTTGITPVDS